MKNDLKINLNSPNVKAILVPVGILFVLIVVFIFAAKIGFGKINDQKAELEKNKKVENILADKERILSDLSDEMDKYTNAITLAMPERYSGFIMIAQIKSLALENNLMVTELKGGSESMQGSVNSVDVTFSVEGPMISLLRYFKAFNQASPVSNIERAKFTQSGGMTKAEVVLRTYFGSYPTKLPAINDPLKDLTAIEKDMLSKIIAYRIPTQIILTPQQPGVREDPFN
jgi:Tfp pilus assembly protein PilO